MLALLQLLLSEVAADHRVAVLIEAAVRLPKYKEILHTPEESGDGVVEEMGLDKLSPERIQELQQLLGMLQKLKE